MPTTISKLWKSLKIRTERDFWGGTCSFALPQGKTSSLGSSETTFPKGPARYQLTAAFLPFGFIERSIKPYCLKWTFVKKNTQCFQRSLRIQPVSFDLFNVQNRMRLMREWNLFPFHLPSALTCSWSQMILIYSPLSQYVSFSLSLYGFCRVGFFWGVFFVIRSFFCLCKLSIFLLVNLS